ncbi:TetR family transcriptional regulator [Luteococcus japonicus]|uniref:TetR family transcriptional regulator n=1 Tax=Luteococcus japonicus TaxID=33984 RepID=A0A3N1ZRC2_9ACTN|nr:TetR/AcrR family transcriptional regulator [Luteococcus japonicus]ROR53416.1 TetR family transcriptional regulator [Luteococcus japonicus]
MTVGLQRPGGRTSRTRAAVLSATRELLVEQGPGGMRMELIARRSGVHRSSIYRRWGSPAGVVADLAREIGSNLEPVETGTLSGDLAAMARRLADQLAGDGAALVLALSAWRDPEVHQVLGQFWADRREEIGAIVSRHGSPADPGVVLRVLVGPLHYQALLEKQPITNDTVRAAAHAASTLV